MDYLSQQRAASGRNSVGLGIVVVLHIPLGWALLNGLARKVVEVIKAPIETKIIEEVKPPPPPPPENLPPPPKMTAPPPSFVPPPEVQVANPPPAPAITVTREAPPPAPVQIAPPPSPTPAPAAPPAPPAPPPPAPKHKPVDGRVANLGSCVSNDDYPPAALRAEASGTTKLRLTIDAAGKITKAEVVQASGPTREHRLLDRLAVEKIANPACPGVAGTDETGKPAVTSTVIDVVWKINS